MMQTIEDGKVIDSSAYIPVWTISNVTASRAAGTGYQNNTGKTMFVYVYITVTVAAAPDQAYASLQTSSNGIAYSPFGTFGILNNGPGAALQLDGTVNGVVPPGMYYKIIDGSFGSGGISINQWIEAY